MEKFKIRLDNEEHAFVTEDWPTILKILEIKAIQELTKEIKRLANK